MLNTSDELDVAYHQQFELETLSYFSAGVQSINNTSIIPFRIFPINNTAGEFHLQEGAYLVWIERLKGAESMDDVVSLHLNDDEGFVPYHPPSRQTTVERFGVEYELLFTIRTDTDTAYSIETSLRDDRFDGEPVEFMVTHDPQRDPYSLSLGLVILLTGLAVILHTLFRRARGMGMERTAIG
jgi:hypothetical protein